MTYKVVTAYFDKTSCWPNGPKKPSTTTVEGTASDATSALNSVIALLSSLDEGEDVIISIKVKE